MRFAKRDGELIEKAESNNYNITDLMKEEKDLPEGSYKLGFKSVTSRGYRSW